MSNKGTTIRDMGKSKIADGIKTVVSEMMEHVMNRVLIEDPFVPEMHHAQKPIYAALVPDEIFKGSHFERRFTTPFGRVWEKLASVVATAYHGNCEMGKRVDGVIRSERLKRIQEVLGRLEHPSNVRAGRVKPDWNNELAYVLAGSGEPVPCAVVCDVYINSAVDGKRYAIELKGPLPNSDQTKVSKEKLLKLLAMEPAGADEAIYALPYNPYGERRNYAWGFPARWFDMHNDPSVKIGSEFWDLIGGDGTYETFIAEINSLGVEYRERIYRDYLGIEPPASNDGNTLR